MTGKINPDEKAVLIISVHNQQMVGMGFPTKANLEKQLGISRDRVNLAIEGLLSLGLIVTLPWKNRKNALYKVSVQGIRKVHNLESV